MKRLLKWGCAGLATLIIASIAIVACAAPEPEPPAATEPTQQAKAEESADTAQPTNTVAAMSTPAPTATPPPPTPTPQPTEPTMSFNMNNFGVVAQDPDAHVDAAVEVIGRVFQPVDHDEDGTYWQMYTDPFGGEHNTLVGLRDPDFELQNGDYVRISGTIKGMYETENAFGQKLELIAILAEEAEVVNALAAAPAPDKTVEIGQTQTQHNLSITLQKIQFASTETRVLIELRNAGNDDAIFYDTDAKAVQGDQQFDAESHDYPDISSEILPGVRATGVIVFSAMKPNQPITVLIEAHTDDYNKDFERYVFDIAP